MHPFRDGLIEQMASLLATIIILIMLVLAIGTCAGASNLWNP